MKIKSCAVKWLVFGGFSAGVSASCSALQCAEQPNFIIIMADDQGYADVGFQDSPDIVTPNIDQLAAKGLVFENGYVCHPVCGPSRTGLMTGRYPHRFGLQVNTPFSQTDEDWGVPLEQRFFAQDLRTAGYRTGVIGKWHLGATEKHHPNNRGFDFFFGFLGGGHNYWPADYKRMRDWQFMNAKKDQPAVSPNPEAISYMLPILHNREYVETTGYLTDIFSDEAVDFIDRNKTRPFFLYLAYNAPHKPLEAKPEDLEKFSHIQSEKRRKYAAMIYALDRGVGQVRDKLEKERLLDNTMIIYLSDNGGIVENPELASNGRLRGQKGETFEGGCHVPFVVHWPARLKAGRTDGIISSLDIYPTLLAAAGLPVPTDRNLDGFNQLPFLLGQASMSARDGVFARRWLGRNHTVGVRDGDWKYDFVSQSGETGLFNLKTDIGEKNDLSAQYPEQLQKMTAMQDKWNALNTPPKWIEPGWYWPEHREHAVQVILSFEEEMAAHDGSLKE
ncbi:sulfatase family protein [Tichowtungia aerotolerans]|uniref:Sulfatase-like hydrolase/transferase n=1 Tax=Tichowtungia aerotolerans TaxID=2697043 RepID=A0A6P1MGT7_9BACT|nr:sulfatase-like hydrolase/transferase [Tichowtungia aerotolerans]QHI70796.1 sulfatase-like hydrolase/transferase [Tichowtungia aerotolerans]